MAGIAPSTRRHWRAFWRPEREGRMQPPAIVATACVF